MKTLRAVERAAMRWWHLSEWQFSNSVDFDLINIEIGRAWKALSRACASHAKYLARAAAQRRRGK